MLANERKENTMILEKSIDYLKARGYTNIKTDLPGYENPKSFVRKSNGLNVGPDISANKNGKEYYFDISLKTEGSKLLKSKWLLLDAVARLKSFSFKIITTTGHVRYTDNLLEEVNLSNKTPIRI
ncbi:MAG: hypothetical protein KJO90_01755 [Eudoraea sp.]|nr:hypothetical protein [Eudoraea sp.]